MSRYLNLRNKCFFNGKNQMLMIVGEIYQSCL